MALLNRAEETPHTYIHSSSIPSLELKSAIEAFSKGDEYINIHPFVKRFDYTVDLDAQPSTKDYLKYPLAEIVWDLHTFGALKGLDRFGGTLQKICAEDRALSTKPSLKKHFPTVIERNLKLYHTSFAAGEVETLANWIYANPTRCPSTRLGYEVWHKMIRNVNDKPKSSDLEDYCHIECLPYVDLMTLDRTMRGYVSQACVALKTNYDTKVCSDSKEIIDRLMQ